MIPSTWLPYYREDDGELIGYLQPVGALWRPMTLFGYAMAEPMAERWAGEVLSEAGLAYLAEAWLYTAADGTESRMSITELTADQVTLVPREFALVVGNPELADPVRLSVPTDRLRPA